MILRHLCSKKSLSSPDPSRGGGFAPAAVNGVTILSSADSPLDGKLPWHPRAHPRPGRRPPWALHGQAFLSLGKAGSCAFQGHPAYAFLARILDPYPLLRGPGSPLQCPWGQAPVLQSIYLSKPRISFSATPGTGFRWRLLLHTVADCARPHVACFLPGLGAGSLGPGLSLPSPGGWGGENPAGPLERPGVQL